MLCFRLCRAIAPSSFRRQGVLVAGPQRGHVSLRKRIGARAHRSRSRGAPSVAHVFGKLSGNVCRRSDHPAAPPPEPTARARPPSLRVPCAPPPFSLGRRSTACASGAPPGSPTTHGGARPSIASRAATPRRAAPGRATRSASSRSAPPYRVREAILLLARRPARAWPVSDRGAGGAEGGRREGRGQTRTKTQSGGDRRGGGGG